MKEIEFAAVCALEKELDETFEEAHMIVHDIMKPSSYYLEET